MSDKVTYLVRLQGESTSTKVGSAEVLSSGVLYVQDEDGGTHYYSPSCWLRVDAIHEVVDLPPAKEPEASAGRLEPNVYTGTVVSYPGSGSVLVDIEGEEHAFSLSDAQGDLEDSVVVMVAEGGEVTLMPVQPVEHKVAPKWWEVPGEHSCKFVGMMGTDACLMGDTDSTRVPGTLLKDGPPPPNTDVILKVNPNMTMEVIS